MRYFILVKRKTSKRWEGTFPAKAGLSKSYIDRVARMAIKPGYSYKIIPESSLNRLYLSRMRIKRKKTKARAKPRPHRIKRKKRKITKRRTPK